MDRHLLQSVLKLLCKACHAEEATYWIPASDGLGLRAVLNEGPRPQEVEGFLVPISASLVGWVWASGQGLCLGEEGHYHRGLDARTGTTTRAMMAAPVRGTDASFGVLSVINPSGRPTFQGTDLAVLDLWCEWLERVASGLKEPVSEDGLERWTDAIRTLSGLDALTLGKVETGAVSSEASVFPLGGGWTAHFAPEGNVARESVAPFTPILARLARMAHGLAVDPEMHQALPVVEDVEELICRGEYLKAADLAAEYLAHSPSGKLKYLLALALARGRSLTAAKALLEEIDQESLPDPEVQGLLARLAKDLWEEQGAEPDAPGLQVAITCYETAHAFNPGHWPAINAATLCRIAGETSRADRWLGIAQQDSLAILETKPADTWAHATLGEIAIHQGETSAATHHYGLAFSGSGPSSLGSRASARRNGRLLLEALGEPEKRLDDVLPPSRVVVFAGHLMDAEDRPSERFPERLVPVVEQALETWAAKTQPHHVLSAAACGSDLLLLEVLAAKGIPFTVALPCEPASFIPVSVGVAWEARFHRILALAEQVYVLNEGGDPKDSSLLSFATQVLLGLGVWKARDLEGRLEAMAVWDPETEGGPGGTAEFLARAQSTDLPCSYLDLGALRRTGVILTAPLTQVVSLPALEEASQSRQVYPFLFGDLAGFSAFRDSELEAFVEHGLGLVGRLRTRYAASIQVADTWGDGLFLVFDSLAAAVGFSTDLLAAWAQENWASHGLQADMKWRLSLHAGALARATDPVALRPSLFGKPLVRAARMEPITPPNAIYVSLEFGALMMLEGCPGFSLDYAGEVSLPKNAGKFPLFRLRRLQKEKA